MTKCEHCDFGEDYLLGKATVGKVEDGYGNEVEIFACKQCHVLTRLRYIGVNFGRMI